jgi:hypothetical protein
MKPSVILFAEGIILLIQSCSKQSETTCPGPINNALGTYTVAAAGTSFVKIDSAILDSLISVKIKNFDSCDYVNVELLGDATGIFRAKFQNSTSGIGDSFLISEGQFYSARGLNFRTYEPGFLTIKNAELTLAVNANARYSASGGLIFGNLTYNLRK